jgi:hypothetical protein
MKARFGHADHCARPRVISNDCDMAEIVPALASEHIVIPQCLKLKKATPSGTSF